MNADVARMAGVRALSPARSHIAVLGGGFQGSCLALALAERGARVTLFEREPALLEGAATASEGKIHLGYVYARDRSLATARTMIRGAMAFCPLLCRWLGTAADDLGLSSEFVYLVHRDSQIQADEFAAYLARVHDEARDADCGQGRYFSKDMRIEPRPLTRRETVDDFGEAVVAGFSTPEIAVNMLALADRLRARIAADPRIELRLGFAVRRVEDRPGGYRVCGVDGGRDEGDFNHVINALWGGRLAVDAARGLRPRRPWLHRFKFGIRFRLPDGMPELPSTTIVHGPFGDTVRFDDGTAYLSWYPCCMTGSSADISPPAWQSRLDAGAESELVASSFAAMAEILPALRWVDVRRLDGLQVKGGIIVAWGKTDIDDPASELHQRFAIGITASDAYFSIDPGKLTNAPLFAQECAERILEPVRHP